jgi:hypothetical protein
LAFLLIIMLQVDFLTFYRYDELDWLYYCESQKKIVLDPIGSGEDHVVVTPGGERELLRVGKCWPMPVIVTTEGGDFDRAKRQQKW